MTPFDLLTLALATWYLSYVIVKLDSPFHLLGRARTWATARATLPDGTLQPGSVGDWLSCVYCVSPYVAAVLWLVSLTPLAPLLYPFAIAGAALLLHKYVGGFHT